MWYQLLVMYARAKNAIIKSGQTGLVQYSVGKLILYKRCAIVPQVAIYRNKRQVCTYVYFK